MSNLREYREIIRQTVREVNAEDSAYTWRVASISATEARIRWSYLSENELFVLTMGGIPGGEFVIVNIPCTGERVFASVGPTPYDDAATVEEGIARVIRAAAAHAHHFF